MNVKRDVRADGGQVLAQQGFVAEVAQRLPVALPFDSFIVVEHSFERPEAPDQLGGALGTDVAATLAVWRECFLSGQRPGARNVVAGIAGERQPVHHFRGRDPQNLFHLGFIAQGLDIARAARRFQYPNAFADQLKHVFIAGYDQHLHALLGAFLGQGSDHVVRLKTLFFDDGETQGAAEASHVRKLDGEVLGKSRPIGLVGFEELVAKGRGGEVKDHSDMRGTMVLHDLAQCAQENVNGFGGHAARRDQRRLHGREEGAKHQRHGVDQKELVGGTRLSQ